MYRTVCFVVFVFVQACQSYTNVTVTTSKGPVVGLRRNNPYSQASYDTFLGIPYGQVLARFQPPVPRANWSVPLATQTDGPACPQPGAPFSEDCLYLNVFTPVNASMDPGVLPVMAYIHGSAFTFGSSSSLIYGPDFIVPEGVILVTMNYRMGAAGFLTLGSSAAPGNLGLLDTQLGLGWIQQEISAFGGDPGKVTLVGQSAGSVMTMFHYLSPVSSAMFQRAIAHSGSALSTWGHVTSSEAVRRAKLLAAAVGCDTSQNDTKILACLQQMDINTIVNHQNITLPVGIVASGNQLPFVPVLDMDFGKPAFFSDNFTSLLKAAAKRSKPLIAGFTTEEGIMLFGYDCYKIAEANLKSFVPRVLEPVLSDGQKIALGKKIESKYFPETVDQNKVLDIVRLYTDYLFAHPTIDVIKQLSNITYGYVFTYDGPWAPTPSYFSRYHVTGVNHGDDLYYLFYSGQDCSHCSPNQPNLDVRNNMVQWWTNFIKSGVPDTTGLWNTASNGKYLLIDSSVSTVNASDVEALHYDFWANITASDLNNSSVTTAKTSKLLTITTFLCIILKYYF